MSQFSKKNREEKPVRTGKVYLVGAGPGDPELLTLRAVKCLAAADIILYDYLVDERTLEYARENTELVSLGRPYTGRKWKQTEINQRMVDAAKSGQIVVRLKGGDPHIFGRLHEEMQSLKNAAIPYEVVPGITSASAAAQVAGISLTDRRCAGAVTFITGHLSHEHDPALPILDFGLLATFPGTLVFYMGIVTVELWSRALQQHGMPSQTPVIFVYNATLTGQKIIRTTLADAAKTVKKEQLQPPCLVIIGDVAGTSHAS